MFKRGGEMKKRREKRESEKKRKVREGEKERKTLDPMEASHAKEGKGSRNVSFVSNPDF